jgi:hypothetical protein
VACDRIRCGAVEGCDTTSLVLENNKRMFQFPVLLAGEYKVQESFASSRSIAR